MGVNYRTWVRVGANDYDDVVAYAEQHETKKQTFRSIGSGATPLSKGYSHLAIFLYLTNKSYGRRDENYTKFNPAEDENFMRALIQTSKAFPDVPIKLEVMGEFNYDKWTVVKNSTYKDGEEFPVGKYEIPKDDKIEPTYSWKPVNIGESMNNPKIKELIEAAAQKKGYVVEKLTKNILAAKVNDLIQEKKKEIKLGE